MKPKITVDLFFKIIVGIIAASALVILLINAFVLVSGSTTVFGQIGTGFLTSANWNAVTGRESYGIVPYVWGTLITSGIALLIGVPLSLGIAIFLVEMAPKQVRVPISYLVELLAAVPSVIFGLWGLFVLSPWLRDYIEKPVNATLGWIPIFSGTPLGTDVFTAGVILSIMIIPTVASLSKEVISAVPNSIREGAYSIGATKWETIHIWVLGYGRSGIFGAVILGLGRAVGETMAVTMVIGNAIGPSAMPYSLFRPGQTLPSLIANGFLEAPKGSLESSAYIGAGLVLLAMSLIINIVAYLMVSRLLKVKGGAVE